MDLLSTLPHSVVSLAIGAFQRVLALLDLLPKRETSVVLLAALAFFFVYDWLQTVVIARDPRWHEAWNPFLGRDPSVGNVNWWFLGWALVAVAIVVWVPVPWAWGLLVVGAGIEARCVFHNRSIGIRL